MLKKVKKFFLYLAMLPLYWISYIIPRDKNLWVFGAWFGKKYADNSKYLFKYINEHHPEIKAIWLTSDENTFQLLKKKKYNVLKTYSVKGFFYSLRAKVGVISTSLKDINPFVTSNMRIVQLWHGSPLKKIMFDDKISFKHPTLLETFFYILFPFLKKEIYYSDAMFISTSKEVQKTISSAFKVPLKQVKITGYPRNDAFFQNCKQNLEFIKKLIRFKKEGKKIAIYMPTHRKEGQLNIKRLLFSNLDVINEKLQPINCILLIKLHYYHMKDEIIKKDKNFSNLIIINDFLIEQDIYNILKLTDVLITDYSSVYFDYLLLEKPIIFAPFDLKSYLKEDREFYYNYDKITPGPKARNWTEVINFLNEAIQYPKKYQIEREMIKKMFHYYQDGNSSKRVYEEILRFIHYYENN